MWLNTLMLDVERRAAFPQEPGGFMKMAVVRPKPSPSPSPNPNPSPNPSPNPGPGPSPGPCPRQELRIDDTVDQFATNFMVQLDFHREAHNLRRFAANFASPFWSALVSFPQARTPTPTRPRPLPLPRPLTLPLTLTLSRWWT